MIARATGMGSAVRAVVVAAALLAAGLILVRLADVVLMAFGAVLVAVLLEAVTRPLDRLTGLGRGPCLALAVAAIVVASGVVLWLFGSEAGAQLDNLSELLPKAWAGMRERLAAHPLGGALLTEIERGRPQAWLIGLGPKLAGSLTAFLAGGVIVAFAGLYIAAHPRSYRDGALLLAPPAARERLAALLQACRQALGQWLIGQLISMALVGSTVALGLWLSGVPSPVALGVIAGLGQFVPVIGPLAATLPGLLAAAGVGWQPLAWAAVTYLAASQFEANVITPLILRRMVQLPMAVTLFAVLASGVLLGPLGVLFATPLAVVAHVALRQMWVDGARGADPPPSDHGVDARLTAPPPTPPPPSAG